MALTGVGRPTSRHQMRFAIAAGIGLLGWGADGRPEPQGTLSPEEVEQALARFFDRPVPAVPYLLEHW